MEGHLVDTGVATRDRRPAACGSRRCIGDEHVHADLRRRRRPTSTSTSCSPCHRGARQARDDDRRSSAGALRRLIRGRRRHRLRGKAAVWRGLDQRRLLHVRARRLRLHRRRRPTVWSKTPLEPLAADGQLVALHATVGSGSAWTRCASAISSKNCGSAAAHPGNDGNNDPRCAHALPVVRHRRHQGNSFAGLAATAQRLSGRGCAGRRAAIPARGRILPGLLAGAATAHRGS